MSIQFKRSAAAGTQPSADNIAQGEIAMNTADRLLFTKDHNNKVITIGFSKDYVDQNFIRTTGGIVKGRLQLAAGTMPGSSELDDLVSKRYVDSMFGTKSNQAPLNSQLGSLYISTSGGSMTGNLNVPTATASTHAVNKQYVDQTFLRNDGGTTSGLISCQPLPTSNNHLANKNYVDQKVASVLGTGVLNNYLLKTGGDMSGHINLSLLPTANYHLANKQYVDQKVAEGGGSGPAPDLSGYVQKSGATMTGHINQPAAPTSPSHLSNKAYIDQEVEKMINGSAGTGAPTPAQCPVGTLYVRW